MILVKVIIVKITVYFCLFRGTALYGSPEIMVLIIPMYRTAGEANMPKYCKVRIIDAVPIALLVTVVIVTASCYTENEVK